MTSRPRSHRLRGAFTLLETLLAVLVFSMAVVALVEAINQLGNTTLLRRQEAILQDRMRSLLVEHTRLLWLKPVPTSPVSEEVLQEGGISYTLNLQPLELHNFDGQLLPEMLEASIVAVWTEGGRRREASTSTWVYLPLFRPG
jgi:type II secretory pathway pseudopilin PulG